MVLLRRKPATLLLACAALSISICAAADGLTVPLKLQVDLTIKLLAFAQEPPISSADVVRIGILAKNDSAESSHFATDLKSALDGVDKIVGLPHEQSILDWTGPRSLVDESRRRNLQVLYLTPGLGDEIASIAGALEGVQLITFGAADSYVPSGCILGFDLVSGHPKMVFNIGQAKKQNVIFRSAVMRLMRLVQ